MVCLLQEWYLPSTGLHPPYTHHLLAKKRSSLSVTHSGYWHPHCQIYSPAITIPIPHFIPQRASQPRLQRIQDISARESGVSSLKKEERKRSPFSIPKRVANHGVQINPSRKPSTSFPHTL
jgi:hypothetical protein